MLLCIDIGNTNIALGVYLDEKLLARWRLATIYERMPDEFGIQLVSLLTHQKIAVSALDGCILASVVPPLTEKWVQVCREYLGIVPIVVSSQMKTGIEILYEEPNVVGADRIVDAAAAFRLYGGPACIVDFGTATTFDAITERGEYLGGAITPGINIAAEALFQRTAKLPRVELASPPSAIGRNTTHSMQAGLLLGYAAMVEGMVARFRSELGATMKVVATGGLAEIIARETDVFDYIAPWLTLEGLRMLYEMNT